MARVVGFSLKLEGRAQTIADLDAIERKLTTVTLAIQAAQSAGQKGGSVAPKDSIKPDTVTPGNTAKIKEYTLEQAKLRIQAADTRKELDLQAKEALLLSKNLDPTSLTSMRFELAKLKREYADFGDTAIQSAEGVKKFNDIVSLNDKISAREQAQGDFRRNVGNYRDAVTGLLPVMKELDALGIKSGASLTKAFRAEAKNQVLQIKTSVDQLASSFEKLTAEQKKSAEGIAILNKLESELQQLNQITKQIPSSMAGIKSSLLSVGDIITGGLLTGGIVALTAKFGQLGSQAIKEFEEAEIALVKVDTLVKQTGGSAGFTTAQLKQMADEAGRLNNIDNDKILNDITANLLVFDKIQGAQFAKAQKFAIDIGRTFEGGFAGASQAIGKLLTFPETSSKLLKQFGIDLSKQEEKRIKQLVEQNKLQEAQLIIVEKLEKFTGQGIAQAATELGRFKALTVEFNEALEDIGRFVARAGVGFLDFAEDVFRGTVFMSDANKILKKSQQDLGNAIEEDNNFIKTNIALLKDQNVQGKFRQEIIDKLTAKYPEIAKSLDLQNASIKRLEEIEKELTKTTTVESLKRIAAKENEQLQAKKIEAERELALKRAQVEKADDRIPIFSKDARLDQALSPFTSDKSRLQKEIAQLEKDRDEIITALNKSSETVGKSIQLKTEISPTIEGIKGQVSGIIKLATDALQSEATLPENKGKIQSILTEFISFQDTGITPENINSIAKSIEESLKVIANASRDISKHITDEQRAEARKREDDLRAQLIRIRQLGEEFKKTEAGLQSDEFQKQIDLAILEAESKVNSLNDRIEAIKNQRDSKGNKKPLSTKDKEEIAEIQRTIELAGKVRDASILKTNEEREKSINEGIVELRKQRDEIEQILLEVNNLQTDDKVNDLKFDQSQSQRNISVKLSADTQKLEEDFSAGLISEKQYNSQKKELELQAAKDQLQILLDNRTKILDAYSTQYGADLALLKANKKARLNEIDEAQKNELAAIDEKLNTGKLGTGADAIALSANLKNEVLKKSTAQRLEIEKKYISDVDNLDKELVENNNSVNDAITESDQAAADKRIEIAQEEKSKRIDILKQIKDETLNLANEVANTLLSIQSNNLETEFKARNKNLEKERTARLKLVKGNAAEEEKINREFDQKQQDLDREQFEREKEHTILQAEIQAALAVITAFAQLGPIGGAIAAAFIIATTALKIAEIKSKSFAEGGWADGEGGHTGASQRLPDRTGKRPVGQAELHEKEYIAPDWQTDEHPELFEAFEEDRLNRKHGRSGAVQRYLSQRIKQYAESQAKYHAEMYQPRLTLLTTPIVISPKEWNRMREMPDIKLSKESMKELATEVATMNAAATREGTHSGLESGMNAATDHKMRLERMYKNRTA